MNDWQEIDPTSLFEALASWMIQGPCTVSAKQSEHTLILELHVPKDKMGKIIGAKGRTIDALRWCAIVGQPRGKRILVEVLD